MSDFKKIFKKLEAVEKYANSVAPVIIGIEAVRHYKESFKNQGFTDTTLKKWDDVKRRDPTSAWYGFSYGSSSSIYNSHPKRKGAKKPWKQRKAGASTHYSPTSTRTPILHSQTNELMNSIKYKIYGRGVLVTAAGAYAELINEGGPMKVFGKSGHTMPKRQFMGSSVVLRNKLAKEIKKDITNIINR